LKEAHKKEAHKNDKTMRVNWVAHLCLLIATLAAGACTLVITPPPPAERSPNGVIFTAEQAGENLTWLNGEIEGVWTPTDADVVALEADLLPFLRTAEHS
jgi:hypothetical protein